ncbi:hypothetical protein [Microbulbifer epialgicus]|uniref:Uncharacterized protein n=1 Tax=Microbulbifer epialgicus TaxID=393907 RepID=A0ABV4P3K6_9GAMM
MAGHPQLNQVKSKTERVPYSGTFFIVEISYHNIDGIDGYVVGLKFYDQSNSTDSAKVARVHPFGLGRIVAQTAIKMILPDLDQISIFGFYLQTEGLEARRKGGAARKKEMYQAKALLMHKDVKSKLKHLTRFEVDGGLGWTMSEHDYSSYPQLEFFERELAKQLEVILC